MKQSILILTFLLPLSSHAKVLKASEISWLTLLAEKSVRKFYVCGSSEIHPTKKSLSKHFILGSKQTGFLFSNLISYQQYRDILSEKKLDEAKSALQIELNKAHLWKYSKEKGFEDLGAPSKINLHFSATIRDCMESSKTTLGIDCSRFNGDYRHTCCSEKLVGPVIFWQDKEDFKLMYSPDPSVRLKVNQEKKHRYCNVQDAVVLQ